MSGFKLSGRRAVVLCVVLAAATLGVGSATGRLGGDDDLVRARFASAAPLIEGNQVKVDGVVVGTVEKLEVKNGVAEVSLDLDDNAMPLHDNARLTIRPVSLLGERYVDLDRGDPSRPVLDHDAVIPLSQTANSVGLDELLNTVDDPSGEGLKALVTTLGEGLRDNGGNVDEALKVLSPSLRDTRKLAAVLKEHNALLSELIENFEPVAGALADSDGHTMDQLIASSDQVLAAVADRQQELDATLAKLPGTLTALRSTLSQLRVTAGHTAPTLAELRPLTDQLPDLSAELKSFSDALDPALASSEPVLERAQKLLEEAAPVAASARKAGPGLAATTKGFKRVSGALTRNRENLFNYVRYWALTTNGRDGLSHYFRVNASLNPATLTGLIPGTAPTPRKKAPGAAGDGGNQGPLPGLLDGTALDGLLGSGSLLRPPDSTRNAQQSPTGLSEQQEIDLLGLLLGGR